MNPDRLLKLYDRVADAPGAVERLRKFVLDLAVRGKLVEQDPADEPASELLMRIEAEKARLVKTGEIRNSTVPAISPVDFPYAVPSNWTWARLGAIGDWGSGSTPSRSNPDLYGGSVTWLKSGELGDRLNLTGSEETITEKAVQNGSFRRNQPGDVLIAMYGATIGKLAILAEEAVTNQAVCGCTPFDGVFNRYLFLFLLAHRVAFQASSEGGAQPNISKVKIVGTPIPLPPLAEQHRIVTTVNELMALLDRLETARTQREITRNRLTTASLTTASLTRLTAPETTAEDFPTRTHFALDNLDQLTSRPDQIKTLRQTILNLAVRGKLVEQDPEDEPASELLKRIAPDLDDWKGGRGRKPKRFADADFADAPYELPDGWSWARFPELGKFGRGKSRHRPRNDPELYAGGTHLMIQTGDVARSGGRITTYTNKYNDVGLGQSMLWPKGTLCITIAANIADSGILDFDACFPDSVVGFIPAPVFESARYFEYFVRTAKANLLEFAPATAQKNINLEILTSVLIPLPPLAEQLRIVAKVDSLLALCNGLQTAIAQTGTARSRLLQTLLRDALEMGRSSYHVVTEVSQRPDGAL